jgi:hypothetical protein
MRLGAQLRGRSERVKSRLTVARLAATDVALAG